MDEGPSISPRKLRKKIKRSEYLGVDEEALQEAIAEKQYGKNIDRRAIMPEDRKGDIQIHFNIGPEAAPKVEKGRVDYRT